MARISLRSSGLRELLGADMTDKPKAAPIRPTVNDIVRGDGREFGDSDIQAGRLTRPISQVGEVVSLDRIGSTDRYTGSIDRYGEARIRPMQGTFTLPSTRALVFCRMQSPTPVRRGCALVGECQVRPM